jgi:hypothetical protein
MNNNESRCRQWLEYNNNNNNNNNNNEEEQALLITCVYHRKLQRRQKQNYTIHWPFQLCYTVVKIGPLKQQTQEE